MVIKSNEEFRGAGRGFVANRVQAPDIYTPSVVVRPVNVPPESREFRAADITHELLGHAFAGMLDNEPGVPDLMTHYSGINSFNEQHTQFLRSHFALTPQNYLTPKNEIKPLLVPAVSGQILQSQEMSFSAVVYTPTGTTQLYSEITPHNNDGPGVPDYIATPEAIHAWSEIGRRIPPPPQWYILLPDMTYTWKVCSSGVAVPIVDEKGKVIPNDPRWTQVEGWPGIFFPNPCAEIKIKTPIRDSSKIGLVTLAGGQETNNRTPTLVWKNGDTDVYYYEVQVSKDSTFETNPATATAAVYWELRHGGMTNPLNSYTVPKEFPLEQGQTYYWRVRPRVQGDGTPVEWSTIGSFKTSADAGVQTYSPELVDKDYGNGIIGPSQEDYDRANPQPEPVQSELTIMRKIQKDNTLTKILIPATRQAILPKEDQLTPVA